MGLLVKPVTESHPAAKDPEAGLARLVVGEFTGLDLGRFVAVLPARRPHLGFNLLEYRAVALASARLKKGEGLPYCAGWPCQDGDVTGSPRSAPLLAGIVSAFGFIFPGICVLFVCEFGSMRPVFCQLVSVVGGIALGIERREFVTVR